jgi:ATP-dependent DNA ligase
MFNVDFGEDPPLRAPTKSGRRRHLSRRGQANGSLRRARARRSVSERNPRGEICCLAPDGRSQFNSLLFRREWPYFLAFDLLWLDGEDLRIRPLHERKRRLAAIMPRIESRVRYVGHIKHRGIDLFRVACKHDLEGIVAKWLGGTYQGGQRTSWLKIRNPEYLQWDGRRDLFEARRDHATPRDRSLVRPELALE